MTDDIAYLAPKIIAEFKRLNLVPPMAIVLGSHEDGMRLLSAIGIARYMQPSSDIRPVAHPDGSAWMELEYYGLKFHWPARPYATKKGYVFT